MFYDYYKCLRGFGGCLPRMRSDAFSAIIMTGALVFPDTILGITLPSTTLRFPNPCTLKSISIERMINMKGPVRAGTLLSLTGTVQFYIIIIHLYLHLMHLAGHVG